MKKALLILLCLSIGLDAVAQKPEHQYPETYVQYVPGAFVVGAPLFGLKPEHGFGERMLKCAVAYTAEFALVYGMKNLITETRPDGSSDNSFPSGHTATAFVGAELVRQEFGWAWGGLFYASAVYVGVMRVEHGRHWWWDTLAGAGIGIASAWVGKYVSEQVWQLLGQFGAKRSSLELMPSYDPYSGALCAGFTYRF